jgi:stage III sporulation protein AD
MQNSLAIFKMIAKITGIDNGLVKVLLKIVGVGYLTEFAAGILSDFGSGAVADKVVLGGKITIVVLSLPIFEGLLQMIQGFLLLV